ncbi:MAG: type I-U CRISPR-associated protein Csb2 [Gammaproteobacteria bacterium]|nr:type I-U CRISPR-associated protein Csb2 [Gammaproteobacteria bacterium]
MSVSLAFQFASGRYHATPYGHHVNEGLVEWPPSPWRLLRALISVGYTSGVWTDDPPPVATMLIEQLSAELPSYALPDAVGTHSRHFMPVGRFNREKVEQTTLVFDTWLRVADGELIVSWPNVLLGGAERAMLKLLVGRLNYLGRSESWVAARVADGGEGMPEANCFPERSGTSPGPGWEQIDLLAPESSSGYLAWRRSALQAAWADPPLPVGRKPAKTLLRRRERAAAPYPDNLLDCLQKDTTWLRSYGWSRPPGSRRVFYWRRADAISTGAPKASPVPRRPPPIEAMLLSLTNGARNDHALPPVSRTLPQAELLHRALVGIAARLGSMPPELTGRDENGRPLRGPHQHAHINPLDLDGDGHLDHVLIWAPAGLSADAQAAIRRARRTPTKGAVDPLRLALAGRGHLRDLTELRGDYGLGIARIQGPSDVWESLTPFVPPRHIKNRGRNTLAGQVRAELLSRRLPEPTDVQCLAPRSGVQDGTLATPMEQATGQSTPEWHRLRHFVRSRQRGPQPPADVGFAIRVAFAEPVCGPIAIGYGSHFGLGLFAKVGAG